MRGAGGIGVAIGTARVGAGGEQSADEHDTDEGGDDRASDVPAVLPGADRRLYRTRPKSCFCCAVDKEVLRYARRSRKR